MKTAIRKRAGKITVGSGDYAVDLVLTVGGQPVKPSEAQQQALEDLADALKVLPHVVNALPYYCDDTPKELTEGDKLLMKIWDAADGYVPAQLGGSRTQAIVDYFNKRKQEGKADV